MRSVVLYSTLCDISKKNNNIIIITLVISFHYYLQFSEITRTLSLYPWYHGNIRRSDSANLILHKQVRHILSESSNNDSTRNNPMSSNTSGVCLVRISGTRHGEYVLTYNYHDRAKHMRLNILSDGQCRVQHLWFNR